MAAVLATMLGCFFYASGNFGFLNVFDLRRPVQGLIGLVLLMLTPPLALRATRWIREPIWWLTLLTLAAELFVRSGSTFFFVVDRVSAMIVVSLLFTLSLGFRERVLRSIVVISAVFSTMVVIQAVLVLSYPSALSYFVLGYDTSTQAERVVLGHPFEYLGLVTPGVMTVFGQPFSRFRSFASEPSALVPTFLVPGLLALTFSSRARWLAVPILVFSVLLAFSGTVYLSLALGAVAWVVLRLFGRLERTMAVLPLAVLVAWFAVLSRVELPQMMQSIQVWLNPLDDIVPAFNKVSSGIGRLTPVVEYLPQISSFLLYGTPVAGTGGLLLQMLMYAGLPGLLLTLMISYRICLAAVRVFLASRGTRRLAATMLYGTFIQVMCFNEFGWTSMSGFIMLLLLTTHLEGLRSEQDERHAPHRTVRVSHRFYRYPHAQPVRPAAAGARSLSE